MVNFPLQKYAIPGAWVMSGRTISSEHKLVDFLKVTLTYNQGYIVLVIYAMVEK